MTEVERRFIIPALPPSANELMRNQKLRASAPKLWRLVVRNLAQPPSRFWPGALSFCFRVPVDIWIIVWNAPHRDADNAVKLIKDGLEGALIRDDSPRCVARTIALNDSDDGQRRVEVVVQVAEGPAGMGPTGPIDGRPGASAPRRRAPSSARARGRTPGP